jgi:hypothetical protein
VVEAAGGIHSGKRLSAKESEMSGGYVHDEGLDEGEHQVVIFTFKGPITDVEADEWNRRINALKKGLGDRMMGVTIDGYDTPERFKKKPGGG